MWEKKVKKADTVGGDGANLHDADDAYPWGGDCSSETDCFNGGTCCQTSADCVAPHTCTITDAQGTGLTIFGWVAQLNATNFAGYNDWRIPNMRELLSIVDYGGNIPTVATAFQGANCGPACADITSAACSCTGDLVQTWSSTSGFPNAAYVVDFFGGTSVVAYKNGPGGGFYVYVRAVRGGL